MMVLTTFLPKSQPQGQPSTLSEARGLRNLGQPTTWSEARDLRNFDQPSTSSEAKDLNLTSLGVLVHVKPREASSEARCFRNLGQEARDFNPVTQFCDNFFTQNNFKYVKNIILTLKMTLHLNSTIHFSCSSWLVDQNHLASRFALDDRLIKTFEASRFGARLTLRLRFLKDQHMSFILRYNVQTFEKD